MPRKVLDAQVDPESIGQVTRPEVELSHRLNRFERT